jgi:hypothetical protein
LNASGFTCFIWASKVLASSFLIGTGGIGSSQAGQSRAERQISAWNGAAGLLCSQLQLFQMSRLVHETPE